MVQTKIMWSWVLLDSARSYAFLDFAVATICLFFSDFTHIFRKYHLLLSLSLSLSLSYFRVFALSLLTSPRTQGMVLVINIQIILDSLSHFITLISVFSVSTISFIRFFPFFLQKRKKKKRFFPFFLFVSKRNYNTSCIWVFFFTLIYSSYFFIRFWFCII